MDSLYEKIYKLTQTIPEGKVLTYKQLANSIGISNARIIGRAMAVCNDRSVPCHRVIKSDGTLAKGFAQGNWEEQKVLLKSEGVKFVNANKIDLKYYQYSLPLI